MEVCTRAGMVRPSFCDVDQRRRGVGVEVPEVVVDELAAPDHRAGLGVERRHRGDDGQVQRGWPPWKKLGLGEETGM